MKQRVYNILMLLLIGGLYGLYYIDYQGGAQGTCKGGCVEIRTTRVLTIRSS